MMASGAGAAPEGVLRSVYEGSISCYDNSVERRPYHRNCGCALHHNKSSSGNNNIMLPIMCNKVSYPMRRAWSEGNLVLLFANSANTTSSPAPPAAMPQFSFVNLEEEEQEENN